MNKRQSVRGFSLRSNQSVVGTNSFLVHRQKLSNAWRQKRLRTFTLAAQRRLILIGFEVAHQSKFPQNVRRTPGGGARTGTFRISPISQQSSPSWSQLQARAWIQEIRLRT